MKIPMWVGALLFCIQQAIIAFEVGMDVDTLLLMFAVAMIIGTLLHKKIQSSGVS